MIDLAVFKAFINKVDPAIQVFTEQWYTDPDISCIAVMKGDNRIDLCAVPNFCGGMFLCNMEVFGDRISFLKTVLKGCLNQNNNVVSYLTAVYQKEVIRILTELGFKEVYTTVNKNSGRQVSYWMADLTEINLD